MAIPAAPRTSASVTDRFPGRKDSGEPWAAWWRIDLAGIATNFTKREPMPTLRQIRYRAAKSRLRAPFVWLRHRGLDPQDTFVASYPRSGSTWLCFLLFEILT